MHQRSHLFILFTLGLLLFFSKYTLVQPVYGVGFLVNDAGDGPDADTGDGVCATSGNVCTLRAAIDQAYYVAGDDIIDFASGITTINLTWNELMDKSIR